MTVTDVIKLSKAGLSDDTIIQQIRKQGQHFNLTTDQLIQLKSAHVSERVIQTMIDPGPPAAQKAGASAPASTKTDARRSGLPTEVGVYAKQDGNWVEVRPEVVYWDSAGKMKSVAAAALGKGEVRGHVNGLTSQNEMTNPAEFLIVVPPGIAITQYQLIRLRQQNDDRELHVVADAGYHVDSAASRDLMSFAGTEIAPHSFSGRFTGESGIEYGFLPPGQTASANGSGTGKIYSFHVAE